MLWVGRIRRRQGDTNRPHINYMANLTNQTSFDQMYRQLKNTKGLFITLSNSIRFNATKYKILLWVLMIANNVLAKWSV